MILRNTETLSDLHMKLVSREKRLIEFLLFNYCVSFVKSGWFIQTTNVVGISCKVLPDPNKTLTEKRANMLLVSVPTLFDL